MPPDTPFQYCEMIMLFITYAQAMGLAFQIADDVLDVTGDATTVGKATGKDADAGKATFVSLLGLDGAVYLGVDGNYRSRFSSNPTPSEYTWVDGYALINLRAGFRADNGLQVFGWVRNVFDKDYFEQLQVPGGNTGLIVGTPGDPRTYGLTLQHVF